MLVYLGVFAVALLIGGRGRLRITLGGVAAGCATIAVVALLSRLHPAWFPENQLPEVLVGVQSRLAYPVGYWNALAGLIAIGLPLLLWAVHSARSIGLRSLAAAAVPALALVGYFTYSRGGLVATAIAVAALVLLIRAPPLADRAVRGAGDRQRVRDLAGVRFGISSPTA